ncbi:MAG: DUF104 domain-containing protein [Chloroflexi bacterium]|nr:DUF104 domain-containing protein [Chloroflexota bacterium]
MERTVKVRVRKGVLEPLEELNLEEGKEILVTLIELPEEDRFEKAMGGWKDTIDCEALLKDIYESRRLSAGRPEVAL